MQVTQTITTQVETVYDFSTVRTRARNGKHNLSVADMVAIASDAVARNIPLDAHVVNSGRGVYTVRHSVSETA
jgi:hypothetical protein